MVPAGDFLAERFRITSGKEWWLYRLSSRRICEESSGICKAISRRSRRVFQFVPFLYWLIGVGAALSIERKLMGYIRYIVANCSRIHVGGNVIAIFLERCRYE